jgi:hypothetical protein
MQMQYPAAMTIHVLPTVVAYQSVVAICQPHFCAIKPNIVSQVEASTDREISTRPDTPTAVIDLCRVFANIKSNIINNYEQLQRALAEDHNKHSMSHLRDHAMLFDV